MTTHHLQRLVCGVLIAGSSAFFAGCAREAPKAVTPPDWEPLNGMTVRDVVISRDIDSYKIVAPKNISDVIPNEGKVYFFVSLQWNDPSKRGGYKWFKWVWSTGDKVDDTNIDSIYIDRSPSTHAAFFASRMLGVGKHQVTLFMRDRDAPESDYREIAEKEFTIVDSAK